MDVRLWLDEPQLRLLGQCLLGLAIPLAVALAFLGPRKPAEGTLPRGFQAPMLAIELPQSGKEVETILQSSGGERRMKNGLLLDLGIILLYASVLAALGVLLCQSPAPAAGRIAGAAAAFVGVAAGLLDIVENVLIWKVINGARDDASLQALTRISLWKWGLLALAFLLDTRMAGVLAGLCFITGIVGVLGLMRHPRLEWAVSLMGITLLVTVMVFAFRPGSLWP